MGPENLQIFKNLSLVMCSYSDKFVLFVFK